MWFGRGKQSENFLFKGFSFKYLWMPKSRCLPNLLQISQHFYTTSGLVSFKQTTDFLERCQSNQSNKFVILFVDRLRNTKCGHKKGISCHKFIVVELIIERFLIDPLRRRENKRKAECKERHFMACTRNYNNLLLIKQRTQFTHPPLSLSRTHNTRVL